MAIGMPPLPTHSPPTSRSKSEEVECKSMLAKLIGRCGALELEAKKMRDDSPKEEGNQTTWYYHYGQEGAFKKMARHLEDVINNLS